MKAGMLSKLIGAALITFGGNIGGDVIAPVINSNVPITLGISNTRSLNVVTEGAAYLAALAGEHVGEMKGRTERYGANKYAGHFLDGLAGGMAAAADPKGSTPIRTLSMSTPSQGVGL